MIKNALNMIKHERHLHPAEFHRDLAQINPVVFLAALMAQTFPIYLAQTKIFFLQFLVAVPDRVVVQIYKPKPQFPLKIQSKE